MSFLLQYFQFKKRVEDAVDETLILEVSEDVRDTMQNQLDTVVYSYPATPMALFSRRYENGGLKDRAMMIASLEPDHVLAVQDIAPMQDDNTRIDLAEIVCQGISYNQPYPRPFIAETQKQVIHSGSAKQVLISGLKKREFDI